MTKLRREYVVCVITAITIDNNDAIYDDEDIAVVAWRASPWLWQWNSANTQDWQHCLHLSSLTRPTSASTAKCCQCLFEHRIKVSLGFHLHLEELLWATSAFCAVILRVCVSCESTVLPLNIVWYQGTTVEEQRRARGSTSQLNIEYPLPLHFLPPNVGSKK